MKLLSQVLDNGLTVFLVPMPNTKVLAGAFVVRAGWKYETAGVNEGVAHFLEHMAFKGTKKRPGAQTVENVLHAAGGYNTAFSSLDYIFYGVVTRAHRYNFLCDILADLTINPLLDPSEIELEKGVITCELSGTLMYPEAYTMDVELAELMFGDHPAGWFGVGNKSQILGIDRSALSDYAQDLFVGPNSALFLAGGMQDPQKLLAAVRRYFSAMPSKQPVRQPTVFQETQTIPRIKIVHKETEQTLIGLGIKCPSYHLRRAPLMLLNDILNASLFYEIRSKRGLCYDIHTDIEPVADFGKMTVFSGLIRERWQEGLEVILNKLRALQNGEIDYNAFVRAQKMSIENAEMTMRQSGPVAANMATMWGVNRDPQELLSVKKRIKNVSIEDVKTAASEVLRDNGLNLVVVGPHQNEEKAIREVFHL